MKFNRPRKALGLGSPTPSQGINQTRKRPFLIFGAVVLAASAIAAGAINASTGGLKRAAPKEIAAKPLALVLDDEPPKRVLEKPAPKPPPPVDLAPHLGSTGPRILELEQKLDSLKYMVGKVDGVFDRATQHGFIAFQKVEGLKRDGRGNDETLGRLSTASTPAPAYSTPPDHLEVNVAKQVVFVVRGGKVANILPTSTGSNKNFTSEGWTRRAVTPNGQFKINRKINGMRVSPLGELYKPSYFNGGIAFHGNGSVPVFPASHGCIRLPMPFADWFFSAASPVGMVVYVHGGPGGPNPQPFIDDAPAPIPPPTPTTPPVPTDAPPPAPPPLPLPFFPPAEPPPPPPPEPVP